MGSQHDTPTERIVGGSSLPTTRKNTQSQPVRVRRGNPLLSFLLFLMGIMLGILATLFFVLFVAHDNARVATTVSTQTPSLTVQIGKTYLTQLVSSKLKTAGIPGDISNVGVILTNDDQIQISGDDSVPLPIIGSITKPLSFTLQPYIQSCQPRVHLINANFADIPLTNFVPQSYEDQINQEIQLKSSDLPPGFTYCATGVHTQPEMLNVTYAATPA